MSSKPPVSVSLQFGQSGRFECELDSEKVALVRQGPRCCGNVAEAARHALASPLDFPTLDKAVLEDDRIAIALDRQTPGSPTIIAEIWKILASRNVQPANVTIIQPAALSKLPEPDPRSLLPDEVRETITLKIHDPTDPANCGFLTKASTGEEVYLARDLIDAGLVLLVGMTAFDPVLGIRGTSSVLYPGLSNVEAIRRSLGISHQELSPSHSRPLRQLVDEIAWLMGIQFSVQVTPASNREPFRVVAGNCETVYEECKAELHHNWFISMPERVHTVVVAISDDIAGHGWQQLGAALNCAQRLVEVGGKIIVLSEIKEQPGEGIRILRQFEHADECMPALKEAMPLDFITAANLVTAARRARIYLLSKLDPDVVEEAFMYPLENENEALKLVKAASSIAFIGSAQHAFGIVD